jgi:hypothetical protein
MYLYMYVLEYLQPSPFSQRASVRPETAPSYPEKTEFLIVAGVFLISPSLNWFVPSSGDTDCLDHHVTIHVC